MKNITVFHHHHHLILKTQSVTIAVQSTQCMCVSKDRKANGTNHLLPCIYTHTHALHTRSNTNERIFKVALTIIRKGKTEQRNL